MAPPMPLDSKNIEDAVSPWASDAATADRDAPASPGVCQEADVILQILEFAGVVACAEEVRCTFSKTKVEAHLADALMAGGVGGSLDAPRMLQALRAAATAGSIWAPLWLGDVEDLQLDGSVEDATRAANRREWYHKAATRGHPDAGLRLAAVQAGWRIHADVAASASPAVTADKLLDLSLHHSSSYIAPGQSLLMGSVAAPDNGLALAFASGQLPALGESSFDTEEHADIGMSSHPKYMAQIGLRSPRSRL